MKNKIIRAFEIITVLLMGLLFAQFPLFVNEYQNRLSGHVDELSYQVGLMKDAAKLSGKDLEEYITKFETSEDADFERQGKLMFGMNKRHEALSNSLISLAKTSALGRPFAYFLYADPAISRRTFANHRMGVPLSFEGIVYAFFGCFVGYFLFRGIFKLFERTKKSWNSRKSA